MGHREKSPHRHESVMALRYEVVYYHRQLDSGKADMMAGNESLGSEDGGQTRRKAVMAVLAHSVTADIAGHLATIALPVHEDLREPENGLVMVRGRVGGDGAPFNLGEATVSRAAVRLSTGEVGFGYTLGRDREKARLIALCDAMVQSVELAGAIETQVVAPLRAAMIESRNRKAAEAAATRVDFYTLVRGES
jgi:alpha-D-ribose 1-methylphosphonate 5-triphosphate synthase subunit PhnG